MLYIYIYIYIYNIIIIMDIRIYYEWWSGQVRGFSRKGCVVCTVNGVGGCISTEDEEISLIAHIDLSHVTYCGLLNCSGGKRNLPNVFLACSVFVCTYVCLCMSVCLSRWSCSVSESTWKTVCQNCPLPPPGGGVRECVRCAWLSR